MIPPLIPDTDRFIGLKREPGTSDLFLHIQLGDSYAIAWEEAEIYLRLLDVPESLDILAKVWNFHFVLLNLNDMSFRIVTEEQFDQSMKEIANTEENTSETFIDRKSKLSNIQAYQIKSC